MRVLHNKPVIVGHKLLPQMIPSSGNLFTAGELSEIVGSVEEGERIIEIANDAASGKLTLEVVYPTEEEEQAEEGAEA